MDEKDDKMSESQIARRTARLNKLKHMYEQARANAKRARSQAKLVPKCARIYASPVVILGVQGRESKQMF